MVECLDGFVWSFLGPIIPIIPILALSCKNDTYIECYTPKSHFFWKNKTLKMTVKTPKSQFTWENHGKLLLYNYPKITIFLGKLWQILAQEKNGVSSQSFSDQAPRARRSMDWSRVGSSSPAARLGPQEL
jgi:hypothetical protein